MDPTEHFGIYFGYIRRLFQSWVSPFKKNQRLNLDSSSNQSTNSNSNNDQHNSTLTRLMSLIFKADWTLSRLILVLKFRLITAITYFTDVEICMHVNPRPAGVWIVTRPAEGAQRPPPEISQTTGPISKFQTPFDSPVRELPVQGKKIWPGGHWWRHRSGQSQNFRLFGLGDIGE